MGIAKSKDSLNKMKKQNDILSLIKNKSAIRKYKKKKISSKIKNLILEAGIWGPSILGRQPWYFVVVNDAKIKEKICDRLVLKAQTIGIGGNILLKAAARVIGESQFTIVVYSTGEVIKMASKFKKIHEKNAKLAEPEAVGAAIQNMQLVAEAEGVGSCWFDMPLVCESYINKLLEIEMKMLAILTFGYADESNKRMRRKPYDDMVKVI